MNIFDFIASFIRDLEIKIINSLAYFVGIRWAVTIEDLLMITLSFLAGFLLGQYRIVKIFSSKEYTISDKMKLLVFQKNKLGNIIDYSFRRPSSNIEVIESIIGIYLAKWNRSKLDLSSARKYAILTLFFVIIIALGLLLSIALALHVIDGDAIIDKINTATEN